MTKKEAKELLKAHNHKIKWCSLCKYPMVLTVGVSQEIRLGKI